MTLRQVRPVSAEWRSRPSAREWWSRPAAATFPGREVPAGARPAHQGGSMRNAVITIAVAALATGGCATKKYVGREVGEVNQKVESLTTEVEKTQERVKRSE